MRRLMQIKWLPVLMAATILGIAAFQLYWLQKTYEREKRTLEIRSNMTFRETVLRLQASKIKFDKLGGDSAQPVSVRLVRTNLEEKGNEQPPTEDDKMIGLMNMLAERMKDSSAENDSNRVIIRHPFKNMLRQRNRLMQFLKEMDAAQDTLTIAEISTSYKERMLQQNINVPFTITKLAQPVARPRHKERAYNEVTIGFVNPVTYRLDLGDTFFYLTKRILASIILSLFIVGFITLTFVLLYVNLVRQRRLADIKNEFISNITHELKTPIATVSVAIEALRSFNASIDPAKSKEYLDISANELQRLSMLVDKVLKLSMFEKKEVELKYEPLNMVDLVDEVTSSMRLQFEKHQATVNVKTEGDTTLEGDRLHLVSVIFNLLDNALKYTSTSPVINIGIKGGTNKVTLYVSDNGIGVPAEYRDKVFDKFFRVPTGNLHNAKGYGLGLSYVSHVVNKHHGTIKVDACPNGGSKFIITLPKAMA